MLKRKTAETGIITYIKTLQLFVFTKIQRLKLSSDDVQAFELSKVL